MHRGYDICCQSATQLHVVLCCARRHARHVLHCTHHVFTSTTTLCIRSMFSRYSRTVGSSAKEQTAAVDAWQACAITAPSGQFIAFSRSPRRAMYWTITRTGGPAEAAILYCDTSRWLPAQYSVLSITCQQMTPVLRSFCETTLEVGELMRNSTYSEDRIRPDKHGTDVHWVLITFPSLTSAF